MKGFLNRGWETKVAFVQGMEDERVFCVQRMGEEGFFVQAMEDERVFCARDGRQKSLLCRGWEMKGCLCTRWETKVVFLQGMRDERFFVQGMGDEKFFVQLNYVSCSPYRVPIARLAAARAALKS